MVLSLASKKLDIREKTTLKLLNSGKIEIDKILKAIAKIIEREGIDANISILIYALDKSEKYNGEGFDIIRQLIECKNDETKQLCSILLENYRKKKRDKNKHKT